MRKFAVSVLALALVSPAHAAWDALEQVNAARAARGLRPFTYDANLARAAAGCANWRAERLCEGHRPNDYAALLPGATATATGCAAWAPSYGWGSCCSWENYTYAGAAWTMGRDGRRYMHLFVRKGD
jgi:hypothetical protein